MVIRLDAGPAEALPPGGSTVVKHGREAIAVFNCGDAFYACSNACPHAGGPLSDGFLDGARVACPWHGWAFDLDVSPENAPRDGVERYPVVVEGGRIYVEFTES